MSGSRRFSHAISAGEGIAVLVPVSGPDGARLAEEHGAQGVVVRRPLAGIRGATALPVLWCPEETVPDADACVIVAERVLDDGDELEQRYDRAYEQGLECVVQVDNEDELEHVLERIDPEIFLLAPDRDNDEEALEQVLDLLPSVPAGKLAVADVPVSTREQVVALERAGIDAVIVAAGDVRELVGGAPPEV
jgi:hypothetical protein